MPTYQYACTACDEQLEAVQKFTDDPLIECPACQGRLRKVFSAVGVVFKGSGFYRNDNRSSGAKAGSGSAEKPGSAEKATSTDSGGSSSGDSSSNPAATTTSGSSTSGSSSRSTSKAESAA